MVLLGLLICPFFLQRYSLHAPIYGLIGFTKDETNIYVMVRWYPKGVDDKIPTQGLCDFIVISSDRQTIFSHKALN